MPGSEKSRLELYELLKLLQAIHEPSKYYIISSSVEPAKKLEGLAEIWAWVVLGFGLFTTSFSSDPGLPATSGTRYSSSLLRTFLGVVKRVTVGEFIRPATHRC